jgi:hypothetical protein
MMTASQSVAGASQEPYSQSALPPRGKGRNFIPKEECQLCRSILHVSQDPRIGNGQKNGAFWERITTHFIEATRARDQLQHLRPSGLTSSMMSPSLLELMHR